MVSLESAHMLKFAASHRILGYEEFRKSFGQLLEEWKNRGDPFDKFRQRQRYPRVKAQSKTFFDEAK